MAKANITDPNGGVTNVTMTNIAGTDNYYYNTTYSIFGAYSYFIWTDDKTSNENMSALMLISRFQLYDGWNLISIPAVMDNTTVSMVLSSIEGNYDIVWAYNASDTADPWKYYAPGDPWSDLSNIDEKMGFWIKMNCDDTLFNTGTVPTSTSIDLEIGWNLIGYPSSTEKPIADALSSIQGNYSIVWAYNASDTADPWKWYVPNDPWSDLDKMEPGYGYWIKMNVEDILVVEG